MIAIACTHPKLTKHGKDRRGHQRWKCAKCGATVTREIKRPLGDMRLDMSKAATILRMLLEGMSIRACERLTGVKRDTICDLVLAAGQKCERFLGDAIRAVPAKFIEIDEIWGFVFCKARTAEIKQYGPEVGDSWSWLAIDADTKMILALAVGKRDELTCHTFLGRLAQATSGPCQVTTDGLNLYTFNVPLHMGSRCDFAQLIKTYSFEQKETRYSPGAISGIQKAARFGTPDEARISTSYSERFNLSVRMHNRRFTRLTLSHSKKAEHHAAMMALFVAFYNFCRPHLTLKKQTPAMAAGLAKGVWSVEQLLEMAAG